MQMSGGKGNKVGCYCLPASGNANGSEGKGTVGEGMLVKFCRVALFALVRFKIILYCF